MTQKACLRACILENTYGLMFCFFRATVNSNCNHFVCFDTEHC